MRIHSLSVANFRGIEHLELSDLPETGVVVIHGCNEAGKSSVLDALDLVLRERSTSKKKEVKACAPVGRDVAPEVTLVATVGEYDFTIRKRWLKGPQSELTITAPRPRKLTGREADDELERILETSMDRDLAATLFLRQGQLDPGIAAAGIPSISKALEAAAGDGAGAEDTELMAAVEKEYARYWTPGAAPKAGYKELFHAGDAAREDRDRLKTQVAELARYVDEHARQVEQVAAAEAELPQAREEAAVRAAEAAEAAQLLQRAEAAGEQLARELVTLQRAEQDIAARGTVRERAAELERQAGELQGRVAPAREAAAAEETKAAELAAARDAAKEAVAAAREEARHAGRVRELVRMRRTLASATEQLRRAEEADAEVTELTAAAPERPVSDKDVRALEAAETEVALRRTLLDAAAARLEVAGPDGAFVRVDGAEVALDAGKASVPVVDGTELALGDFTVVFRPSRADRGGQDAAEALTKAERELQELLEAVRCASVAEARTQRDLHAEHAAALTAARRLRDDLLSGKDVATMRAEVAALTARVAELAEAAPGAYEVDEAAAEANVDMQDDALSSAERELEQAEAALRPYLERPAAAELARVDVLAEAKDAELAAARAELAKAEEAQPGDALKAALEAARAAVAAAKQEADALAEAARAAHPEIADGLAQGAANRVASLEQRHADARSKITELAGRIEIAAGVAERADRAEAALEKAKSELERTTRRAEAAKLLYETMRTHRDAARAKYAAPFNQALRKHARVLYGPSVDFTFGDALDITERTVDGTPIPLAELSGGTKEQLAILARFAIADVVSASGDTAPVPVVVDDALGATDPERLRRMNVLFGDVGKRAQVLVFTCFPQRFDMVDAAQRVAIDDLKRPRG